MDSLGLIWIWVGALSIVLGMVLSVVFTTVLNWHNKVLIPISVTTRTRITNCLHR
jgi:predicted lysophospholipase L1 biosynthesis ABC-type transport system permease subunit